MILVDTTPLVALADPRDGLHARATADIDRFARRALVLSCAVLTEAVFLLDHPVQRRRLARLIVELELRPLLIEDEAARRLDVFKWLDRYAEHEPDWADGVLVVAAGGEKRAKVWTYDREFRTTWRRLDGSRIPLAVP